MSRIENGKIKLDETEANLSEMLHDIKTRTIRALQDTKKAEIPILAMTANAFEEDKKNAYKSGMNGHIAKPINVKELMKVLAEILAV